MSNIAPFSLALDLRAFMGAIALCALLSGIFLVATMRTVRQSGTLAAWSISCFAGSGAIALHAMRDLIPDLLVLAVANGLAILAWTALWAGARMLCGQRAAPWPIAIPTLAWLGLCALPMVRESFEARASLHGALIVLLSLMAAWDLVRARRRGRLPPGGSFLVGILVLYPAFLVWRGLGILGQFPGPPEPLGLIAALILPIALVLLGPVLAGNTALERERRAMEAGRAELARAHAGLPVIVFLRRVEPDGRSTLLYRGGDVEMVTGWPGARLERVVELVELSPGHAPDLPLLGRQVLRDGEGRLEWDLRRPDGRLSRMLSVWRVLDRTPDGGALVSGYVLNVTAERTAAANAAQAGRLAALGEMAAGLAHELKQPLQSISLLAETAQLAAARQQPALVGAKLDDIVEQTQRAARIIENLRRFARGAADGEPLAAVPLPRVVDDVLALCNGALREAEVNLSLCLPPGMGCVLAHETGLQQVLLNLFLNARDALAALPPGRPRRLAVEAREAEGGGGVVLRIADSGDGIAPEIRQRLFEPFATTKGPDKGTGLGLSIARGLLVAMGGGIEAEEVAQGACFRITLRGQAQPAPAGAGDGRWTATPPAAEKAAATGG